MTIRTKVSLISIVSIVSVVSVISFLFFTQKQVEDEIIERDFATDILLNVFDLTVITNDYLLYKEDRAIKQWNSINDRLGKTISSGRPMLANPGEMELVESIISDHEEVQSLFSQIQTLQGQDGNEQRTDQVANQLFLRAQNMVVVADELKTHVDQEVRELQYWFYIVSYGSVVGFGLFVLALSSYVIIGIMRHLNYMLAGVKRIQQGEVGYRMRVYAEDEIGQLATSFNTMSEKLKESYSGLERKVDERTKETEKAKQDLEKKVSELERVNKLMIGREQKMIELKNRIKKLESK